ncbi:MAG: hypothetical protein HY567_03465 [Candidatus Kerfeldbacteria bacterium]|nr:hypothetical protein [Candidatus Kerfeldbacteria bacterium]
MKGRKNLLDQLKPLPYFSKNTVYQMGKQLGLSDVTIDTYVSRSMKYREFFQLKKGLYTSADFFNKYKKDISFLFYLANVIRTPSYVSSWAALQYYDLTTEAIHTVTSVTPKVTREYKTRAGNFSYQSIKKELFTGFSLVKGKFDSFIASPSKALFDLLYFRTNQFRGFEIVRLEALVEDLRIDFGQMKKSEQEKLRSMIKEFSHE